MRQVYFPAVVTVFVLFCVGGCTAPPVPTGPSARVEFGDQGQKWPLPVGTLLRVRLYHAIDTRQTRHGDSFIGSLAAPVTIGDNTVLPKGAVVRGSVERASARRNGPVSVTLTLNRIERNGSELAIDTNSITWKSEDREKRNLAWTGGGSGLAGAVLTDKEEARIPAESVLTFRLEQPVSI